MRLFAGGSARRAAGGIHAGFIMTSRSAATMSAMKSTTSLLPVLLIPAAILLIPAGAMLLRAEGWAWGPGDFVVAWVLMSGAGYIFRLLARPAAGAAYRWATGLALGGGFLLLWINGAVGLIGREDNPANLMFGVVPAIGAIGAAAARLAPRGMAVAAGLMATAQFLVPWAALLWRPGDFSPGVMPVMAFNLVFVGLFAGAAALYARAALGPRPAAERT